jgi:hypothetical protein
VHTARILLLLLCLAPLALGVRHVKAGPEGTQRANVHKAFNDLYPVAFRVRVNAALDKGKDWLLKSQRPDGSWSFFTHHRAFPMGSTGLAVLTLLKCGVPRTHPSVVKACAYLRTLPLRRVYSVSVLLMALDAKYAPARDPFAVEDFDRYGQRRRKDPCSKEITPADLAWMKEGVDYLLEHQQAGGYWRYPSGGFDLSNTQFALLGLHAASRCGVKVSQHVWLDALRFCLGHQDKTGEPVMYKANEVRGRYRFEWTERAIARGFKYHFDSPQASASMTTAGLTCLVVCQSRLWRVRAFTGQLRADTRRGVRDGMAWLQQHFRVDANTGGQGRWLYYYLYGLERAGVLGRYRFLGLHDWYKAGAEFLLPRQEPQGYWTTNVHWEGTCFALLFLKRATSRMDAPVLTPSGAQDGAMPEESAPKPKSAAARTRPATPTALAVAVARAIRKLEDRDPDVVFEAANTLGWLGHLRAAAPLVRVMKLHSDADARTAAARALGRIAAAAAVPALIDALDDADPLARHAAEAALLHITRHKPAVRLGSATGRNDRLRLQKVWREHWAAHEDAIRARLKQPKGT